MNIINLIKNLLEFDANKRITVAQALNNDFFKNEIDDYYCKYCLNKISNEELSNKYDWIDKFKICVIWNKIIENEKIKNCEICKNALHISCSKKGQCTCQINITDNCLMKKINNCIFINEKINKKCFPIKIGLKLSNKGKIFDVDKIFKKKNLFFQTN